MRRKRRSEKEYIHICLMIGILLLGGRAGMQRAEADITVTPFPVNSIYGEKASESGAAADGDGDSALQGADGQIGESQSADRQIEEPQNSDRTEESRQNGYGGNGGACVTPFPVQVITAGGEEEDTDSEYRDEVRNTKQGEDKTNEESGAYKPAGNGTDDVAVQSAPSGDSEAQGQENRANRDAGNVRAGSSGDGAKGTTDRPTDGRTIRIQEKEDEKQKEERELKKREQEKEAAEKARKKQEEEAAEKARKKQEEEAAEKARKKREKEAAEKEQKEKEKKEQEGRHREEHAAEEKSTNKDKAKPDGDRVVAADPVLEEINGSWRRGVTEDLAITEYSSQALREKDLQTEILCDGMDVEEGSASFTGQYLSEGVWKYRRTVQRKAFSKDGMYVVRFLADDQRRVAKEVRFYVDRTLPEILYENRPGHRFVTDSSVNLRFAAFDSMGLRKIAVEADGRELCQYFFSKKNIRTQYEIICKLQGRADRPVRKVRLVVTDQAGNRCVSDLYEFIWWKEWIRRKAVPMGMTGVLCLLLLMIIRKRTHKNKIARN